MTYATCTSRQRAASVDLPGEGEPSPVAMSCSAVLPRRWARGRGGIDQRLRLWHLAGSAPDGGVRGYRCRLDRARAGTGSRRPVHISTDGQAIPLHRNHAWPQEFRMDVPTCGIAGVGRARLGVRRSPTSNRRLPPVAQRRAVAAGLSGGRMPPAGRYRYGS
jgi:hypothetical protein